MTREQAFNFYLQAISGKPQPQPEPSDNPHALLVAKGWRQVAGEDHG